jgi:hypothetical protein
MEVQPHSFLTAAIDGGTAPFILNCSTKWRHLGLDKVPSTHLNRTGLDTLVLKPFAPLTIEFQTGQYAIWPLYLQTELYPVCRYSATDLSLH